MLTWLFIGRPETPTWIFMSAGSSRYVITRKVGFNKPRFVCLSFVKMCLSVWR